MGSRSLHSNAVFLNVSCLITLAATLHQMCLCVSTTKLVWGSKDSLWKSVLSFHHVSLREGTQVSRRGNKHLLLRSPFWPWAGIQRFHRISSLALLVSASTSIDTAFDI